MIRGWWKEHWLSVFVGAVSVTIIGGVLIPVFAVPKQGSRRSCLSVVKQLGTATQIYLSESDGFMPPENWMDALLPVTKNIDSYNCPDFVWSKTKRYGFAMKSGVVGADTKRVTELSATVSFFETEVLAANLVMNLAGRNSARHRGGSFVGFLDSHAKWHPLGAKLK